MGLFLPGGTVRTYELLGARVGTGWYTRHVVPGYAHMDCVIGRDAVRDIYPTART